MKRKLVLLLGILLAANVSVSAQQNYKAKFINAFTRYMNWPDQSKHGFFNIGVYGSFDLYKEISEETMGRSVGNQNVVAINILKENQLDLTKLHILVVGRKYCTPENLNRITSKFSNSYTLIVTEDNGILNGAGISFQNNGTALGFKYNLDNINNKGIAASGQFKSMGQGVN
ncbi:YfiR family protein [Fulvivirga sp. 29W222]|uniref:YfiR family protein n=1 Tax=Fulvivirga marina TaxID=2494733 RepID=A0A937G2M6_9BACT|nr:YfiR family protein [Fulvivirga marina]MBL6449106.1 YfiR family protein [Fulvivirga marina]